MNMEQANGIGLALLQAIAGQTQMPKTGGSGELDEFQKLLEEKSQEKDSLLEPPRRKRRIGRCFPKAQGTALPDPGYAPMPARVRALQGGSPGQKAG